MIKQYPNNIIKIWKIFILAIYLFSIVCCTPELKVEDPKTGEANFTKFIAIGGDFLAGYQDGALYKKGQEFCIPALLAQQFKMVGGGSFNQWMMPDNNGLGMSPKPWLPPFVSRLKLMLRTDCQRATSLTPVNETYNAVDVSPYLNAIAGNSVQNFAIPGATSLDYFNPSFGIGGTRNPFYNRIASNPGVSTIYSDAFSQNATFFIAWVGMEDIYNYASAGGGEYTIPSALSFGIRLDSILDGLTSNGAKGVIATIPDFRNFPFYTLIPYNAANMGQVQADSLNYIYDTVSGFHHIHFVAGNNAFLINDANATGGFRMMHDGEYLTLNIPLDSMKCNKYGLLINLINNRYVLDSEEVKIIEAAIDAYNNIIYQKANQYNLALADMNAYFKNITSGIQWNGEVYNAQFVTGGFYSLDGYHPNQKGYALIANEFIRAINAKYKSTIPQINCFECDGILLP